MSSSYFIDCSGIRTHNHVNEHSTVAIALAFKKIFGKLKFPTALFEKLPSFVCLVFKIENKWVLKLQNLFS